MKYKLKRILSLLLCFVMVMGLLPTVSFAEASGSGASEDDPIVVSTFEDLKSALDTSTGTSMTYIKVPEGTVINEVLLPSEYDAAIKVHGFKTLIVDGSVTVVSGYGDDIAIVDGLLNLNGNACYLNLKGNGELTFKGSGNGATNSVVRVENNATLNVSGNLTLNAYFNTGVFGIAVYNNGGKVTIDGATLKGKIASSIGPWAGAIYAVSGKTIVRNAILDSEFVSGKTYDTDNEQGTVYVGKDATLTIEESIIKATTNNENGYSIYLGQYNENTISDYLATNQKVYKQSDYTQLDANVTSLKEDILISSREHRYVNLTFKNKQLRSSLADLTPIDYNPGELELNSYQVYEGLNQTGGTQASTYDNTKDYSAVYTINATDGYAFAADISKDDVAAICGEVWKVERSGEKTLKVYVNFQAVIDQVSLTIRDRANRTTIADLEPTDITPGGVALDRFVIFEGLNQFSGTPIDHTTVYDGDKNYTVGYQLVTTTGCVFADDISTDDVSVTNGEIFDVKSYDGKLLVYVNFSLDEVNEVNLTFKNKQLRSSLDDLKPTDCTPKGLEVSEYQVYDGLNQTGGTQASTYDNTKDYSAVYTIKAATGFAFAASISTNDVTAIGGKVWKVERSDEKTLKVYVNFQAVIDQVSLTIKDRANRTMIADFEPTDCTPGGVYLELFVVFEGLNQYSGEPIDHTTAYDGDKNYTVGYQLVTTTGCVFADDISTDDVSVTNGEIFDVKSYSEKRLVYVNFPANTPTPSEYNITVSNGTASVGAGAAITKAKQGTVVTITANTPAEGKVFDKWVVNSGAVTISDETSATATFTMPASDVQITATYKVKPADVVVDQVSLTIKDKSEWTTIADLKPTAYTPNDKVEYSTYSVKEGLNQTTGYVIYETTAYDSNKNYCVIYVIVAKSGYEFAASFSKENVLISNGEVWDVKKLTDNTLIIYVNFPADTPMPTEYTVTVNSNGNGTVTANPEKAVAGTEITLKADADSGYHFKEWQVISGSVTISSDKFTMPESDVTIMAIFELDEVVPTEYTVTVNTDGHGTVTANPEKAVAGTEITLKADADSGYHFKEWQVISGSVTISGDKFTMPESNVTIKAIFEADTPIPPAHVHNLVHKDAKEATCTETGYKGHYQCTDCDLIFEDYTGAVKLEVSEIVIPATGHVWNSTYSYDADGHWTSCTVCGEVSEKTAHTFNGATCLICGYQKDTSSSSDSSHDSDSNGDSDSGNNDSDSGSSYSSSTRTRKAATGIWIQDEKGWWYKFSNGTYPRNGWAKLPWQGIEYWYYFDADGYMKMGWLESSGSYYYLNPIIGTNSGKMLTGWQLIDQKWYYFSTEQGAKEGSLLRNTVTPDNYQVDQDGVWKQ